MYILAIDPGNKESAFVVIDENLKPIEFGKGPNAILKLKIIDLYKKYKFECTIIEMIAHYGKAMSAGKEIFDTCVWIGRFTEICSSIDSTWAYVYRKDEKINLCGSMKAKDTNIRRALIDRFAQHDFKNGKGTKDNQDWFYGFKADIWAAYAVAVTYHDMFLKEPNSNVTIATNF